MNSLRYVKMDTGKNSLSGRALAGTRAMETEGMTTLVPVASVLADTDSWHYLAQANRRFSFIDFHRYLYALCDEEIDLLRYECCSLQQRRQRDNPDTTYVDLILLRDATQFQKALREADVWGAEGIARSWRSNVMLTQEHSEIDSQHLIKLSRDLIDPFTAV